MKTTLSFYAAIIVVIISNLSCTDLKNTLPTPSSGSLSIHDAAWNDPTSPNFHGKVLKSQQYDLSKCISCHAKSFNGGISGVKCYTCHKAYPHNTGWKTDTSSIFFHGKFILSGQGQIDSCGVCHGSNFTGGTSSKSCYTCHTIYPHQIGWKSDTSSVNFHGKYLLANSGRTDSCGVCHGSDLRGGTSGKSCYTCHSIYPHKTGWDVADSSTFHGKYLKTTSWNVSECAPCHGANFDGGTSGVSCRDCHSAFPHSAGFSDPTGHPVFMRTNGFPLVQCRLCHGDTYSGEKVVPVSCRDCHDNTAGPEECNTCHGNFSGVDFLDAAPPVSISRETSTTLRGVGAHQSHLITGTLGKSLKCQECHTVPANVSDPGHIDIPFNVQVAFNDTLANLKTSSGTIVPNAIFSSANINCSSVYCHGKFKNGNETNSPTWNVVNGTQAACGTCHGNPTTGNPLPGGTHLQGTSFYSCQTCHTTGSTPVATYNSGTSTWTISDQSKHINGKLSKFGSETTF